jgi:hypothetical protein
MGRNHCGRSAIARGSRSAVVGLGLGVWVGLASMQAMAASPAPPNTLLTIDQNRAGVIDRIVSDRGSALIQSGAGLTVEQLRALLMQLRADQLLAASMAGTLDGVRDVLARSLVGSEPINPALVQPVSSASIGAMVIKSVGDPTDDVAYTPVTPCRLVETRGTFAAVYQGDGTPGHTPSPFNVNEVRTYTVASGNGVCTSQLPSKIVPVAVQLQVFGMPTTGASGSIEILPQGATFGATATEVFIGSIAFNTVSTVAKVNIVNRQISVKVTGGKANLAMDIVGYFGVPSSYAGTMTITGDNASVSGGYSQTASGSHSFVGGGEFNNASAEDTAIVGGAYNTAAAEDAVVVGGDYNHAGEQASAVLGGENNTASAYASTVAGGFNNESKGEYSAIVGGDYNQTGPSATRSALLGGSSNTASGYYSTVLGGNSNTASGESSAVLGGSHNQATVESATVLAGHYNVASGAYSVAAGANASANQDWCAVFSMWGDNSTTGCAGHSGVFSIGATTGLFVGYYQTSNGNPARWVNIRDLGDSKTIDTWTHAYLSDAGVWINNSDRDSKAQLNDVDPVSVLAKVVSLPISTWRYKVEHEQVHMGPMAQDFHAAFGLGADEKHIATIDEDGVALAAIQGLYARALSDKAELQGRLDAELRQRDERIQTLVEGLSELRADLVRMQAAH